MNEYSDLSDAVLDRYNKKKIAASEGEKGEG